MQDTLYKNKLSCFKLQTPRKIQKNYHCAVCTDVFKDLEHERMTNKKKLLSRVLLNILEVVLCTYVPYLSTLQYCIFIRTETFFPESHGNHMDKLNP